MTSALPGSSILNPLGAFRWTRLTHTEVVLCVQYRGGGGERLEVQRRSSDRYCSVRSYCTVRIHHTGRKVSSLSAIRSSFFRECARRVSCISWMRFAQSNAVDS